MRLGHVLGGADGLDELVYNVERLGEAKQNVLAVLRLCKVKQRAAAHNLAAVFYKLLEYALQGHCLRHAVDKYHHVEMERVLKRGVLVQVVEHLLRVGTALKPGLERAASAAAMLLTTEGAIADEPKDEKTPAGGETMGGEDY